MDDMKKKFLVAFTLFTGGCSLVPELDVDKVVLNHTIQFDELNFDPSYHMKFSDGSDELIFSPIVKSEYLKELIAIALTNNNEIMYYNSQLSEYEIAADISSSDRFPELNLSSDVRRQKNPKSTSLTGKDYINNSYNISLGISSYDLDLWGKLNYTYRVKLSEYYSKVKESKFLTSEVILNIIEKYYSIVAEKEKINKYELFLQDADNNFRLNKIAYDKNAISHYDLLQSEIVLMGVKDEIVKSKYRIEIFKNELSSMIGEDVNTGIIENNLNYEEYDTDINIGTVNGLIQRRNDISSSEFLLISSNYDVGVARANLLPSINITALSSSTSYKFSDMFSLGSLGWNTGIGVDIPIFDFDKRSKYVDYQMQKKSSAFIKYMDTINKSLIDVNKSLINIAFSSKLFLDSLKKYRLDDRRYYYTHLLYKEGVEDYSNVLNASRDLINAEEEVIRNKLEFIKSQFKLSQSLGTLNY
ncbi:TolC family protein [Vibrio fluvialis]|nr:TolC family protein [Vibrio fluvialis]